MAKIAVMGAGAVGCYYGALLSLAGHEVTLIGRDSLATAVGLHGLRLETAAGLAICHPKVSTSAQGAAGVDLVLVCVKSPDTATAGAQLAPVLSPKTQVLSLQNGINNAQILTQILKREVIPTVVYAAVEMAGPGHVRHKGRGELILPPSGASIASLLSDAGLRVEVSDQAQVALWSKFVVNCTVNALSGLVQQPYGVIAQEGGAMVLMRGLMTEALAVAQAEGIALPQDFWPNIQGIIEAMPLQYSSMAQDLSRQKLTEIEALNGALVKLAARHDVQVPLNSALAAMVRLAQIQGPKP